MSWPLIFRTFISFYCFCFFNCNKMCVLSRRRCPYPLCIVHQVSLTTVNSCVRNLLMNKVYFPICSQTFSTYYLFVPPPSTHHTSNKVTSIVTFNVTQNSRRSYSRWCNVPLRWVCSLDRLQTMSTVYTEITMQRTEPLSCIACYCRKHFLSGQPLGVCFRVVDS